MAAVATAVVSAAVAHPAKPEGTTSHYKRRERGGCWWLQSAHLEHLVKAVEEACVGVHVAGEAALLGPLTAYPAPKRAEIRAAFPAPRRREEDDDGDGDDDGDVF